jgi:hypothetical protein
MSTLFLDIDGVLNCGEFAKTVKAERAVNWKLCEGDWETYDPSADIDPILIERLNKIVEATDCNIVISSSWRTLYGKRIPAIFTSKGFKYAHKIIGQTPKLGMPRGDEIQFYMLDKHNLGSIAILDDDMDMTTVSQYLIQTNWFGPRDEAGITEEVMNKTIRMLNV